MADRRHRQESNDAPQDGAMSQEKPPGLLQQLFFSDPEFNEKKLQDHKRFTAALLVITSLFLPSLWVWDYITDPVGAMNTIGLRLLYLLIILLAVAFWSDRFHYKQLAVALPLTLLVSEGIFVEILNRLGTGMTHGMGGFMYAMFLSVLAGQGIPLFISLGFTVMATALPHAMALAGLAPEFPHLRYGILMWPAMGLTMVTQCVLANEYAQRYQLEARLKALSNTDPLCGIANRRHFTQMLEREIQHNRRYGHSLFLLMLDIDHFKNVNDTYGHAVGDQVIRHLASTLQKELRSVDGLGRIGGEEFAIFITGGEPAHAKEVAERLRTQVEASPTPYSPTIAVHQTVSIGLAQLTSADIGSADVFVRADRALYAAKNHGHNQVVCA